MTDKKIEAAKQRHDQLVEKMNAVCLFANVIAHDFNNVLSGILGFSSFLASKADPGSDLQADLKMIEQSAVGGAELTKKLMTFARRRRFTKTAVNMNDVISKATRQVGVEFETGIELVTELDDNLGEVHANEEQMTEIVYHLCRNALDAMQQTGGTLSVVSEYRSLADDEQYVLGWDDGASYICITVSDTGMGLDADKLIKVFDPYFTTKTEKGHGLGLSIVYGVLANHDGDVLVESTPGKGCTFSIYMPEYTGKKDS